MDVFTNLIHSIWHYTILNVGGSEIRMSNVLLAITLTMIGLKYFRPLLAALKKYLHERLSHDKDAANALEKILSYAIVLIYVISILEIANIPLSSFAFIGGALALGIGLGGQNLMNNFISSLIIMIERPIKIGDIVEINDMTGRITSIGARCVVLTSFSNVEILVPNSKVMQNVVVNWTLADHIITNSAILHIPKGTKAHNPQKTINLLVEMLKNVQDVCSSPTPAVYLTSISADDYEYQLVFSCNLLDITVIELMHSRVSLALLDTLPAKDFRIEYNELIPKANKYVSYGKE